MKERSTESDIGITLESKSVREILKIQQQADASVADAVLLCIEQTAQLIEAIVPRMKDGGRLFYVGAGTSGRLGIVDASECPPTFGVPHGRVVGIIAGGDTAIRKAVEFAEDSLEQAWLDLQQFRFEPINDSLLGISASGNTPYVLGAVKAARSAGACVGALVCNADSPIAAAVEFPIEAITGPEILRGSTRLKAGTAQKLILNQISTGIFIQLGHVKGNLMVDMQLSNQKLIDRGTRFICEQTGLEYDKAKEYLIYYQSVRAALAAISK